MDKTTETQKAQSSYIGMGLIFGILLGAVFGNVGLGIVFPSGGDFEILGISTQNLFRNESVHLQPFLGVYHAIGSRGFSQWARRTPRGTESRVAGTMTRNPSRLT